MGKHELTEPEIAQKAYYNQIAEEYDRYRFLDYPLRYSFGVKDLFFTGMDLAGVEVLDAMCGGGGATEYFLTRGSKVTGLDISEKCCELYAKRYPDCQVACASMLESDLPDEAFDIVVTDSLHHLHPRVVEGMREIHRLLKPGGYFYCSKPCKGSLMDYLRAAWYRLDRRYFETNEAAIDIDRLLEDQAERFEPVKVLYGGNLAYLFVAHARIFRIPAGLLKLYAPTFIAAERLINRLQWRLLSCWGNCLLRKRHAS